ncbi:AAA family ATPase [Candidatus Pacearchaeota archaeon]|nr:AAA family ATPase [Candidatus Pacearchaeota archaeon]
MGKIIGVLSLKGGVGKTSSVVALGDAMADFGKKVLLVDGNFSAPNLGLHLNIVDPEVTMNHVLARKTHVKDSIHKLGKFDIIPSSIFNNLKLNPLEMKDRIKPLKKRYDAILIDSSPSLNEETLAVMLASDGIIIMTTPDIPSLSSVLKMERIAKRREIPILGVVINKANNKNFDLSLEEIEETLGIPVLAVIPYDINFQKSLSEFKPTTQYKEKSKASIEFRKLAGILSGEKYLDTSWLNKARNLLKIPPKRQDINREIYYHRVFG